MVLQRFLSLNGIESRLNFGMLRQQMPRPGERRTDRLVSRRQQGQHLITHLLKQIDYKSAPREKIKLPKRGKAHGYKEPKYNYKFVPEAH